MHIIGGFSPTIASYISLRRNNKVKNFKEWFKKIFDIKHNIWTYIVVILFVCMYLLYFRVCNKWIWIRCSYIYAYNNFTNDVIWWRKRRSWMENDFVTWIRKEIQFSYSNNFYCNHLVVMAFANIFYKGNC